MTGERGPGVNSARHGENAVFLLTFGFGFALIPVAILIARIFSIDIAALLRPGGDAIAWGVAATLPLVAALVWFMRATQRSVAAFRDSQIEFFSRIGFRLTRARIIALSLLAGVSEELLFRGVFQTIAEERLPLVFAIVLPGVLFGALHARSIAYAAIAACVGVYLGVLFWMTQSLTAAVITHSLYDFIAFEWTRRILDKNQDRDKSGRARSSGSSVTG
ncbi:MAG: CPBP family intramembrane metalloprotease [Parvularculaceae bacterium]|nr:CPBP family intramembrane metalloprotease [Parvularculaceae bacterium]